MATIGQKEISKDYPIEEERFWLENPNLIAEEDDLTLQRNRVGLK